MDQSSSLLLHTVRKALLKDMLGSVQAEWKVLIMDELTTRVMSSACRMSDILEENVSLVEDLTKRRQPMQDMPGIYFMSPTAKSVQALCRDFDEGVQYHAAHVFFSSKVPQTLIAEMRRHPRLIERLKTLKEVGCEFLTADSRTFTTDQPDALHDLFADGTSGTPEHDAAINTAASRLATLFSTLKEFPTIRYRQGKPATANDSPGAEARSLVAQRLATKLHSHLTELQRGGDLPATETCDLVVLDRSVDPVSPIIHEWTYEAMVYDLLPLKGDLYEYETENRKGDKETKEGLLEERDPLWIDLRHLFIADASTKLTGYLTKFRSQNKAAQLAGQGGSADSSKLKGVVQSLSEYNQELSKLSLHIDMASSVNKITNDLKLDEVGKLEQDLVFGGATSKELIGLLSKRNDLGWLDKVRLLMTYVATNPEKLDSVKFKQWQKLANLKPAHMHAINNLEFLSVAVYKRESMSMGLSFGTKTKKRQTRKARGDNEEEWELSRFQPVLSEIEEDLAKNSLPESEYPYVAKPSSAAVRALSGAASAGSARTKQSIVGWAKRSSARGEDVDVGSIKLQGKRLIVFVLGGITRSEMRTSYSMSKSLGRDVLLGSTSVETPKSYVKKVYELSALESEASLD